MQTSLTQTQVQALQQTFLRRVYNWMAAGLGLTALVSFYVMANPEFIRGLLSSPLRFWLLVGIELGLVIWLSARIQKMSTTTATFAFFAYAGLNGLTLSPLLFAYTKGSIAAAFLISGGIFVGMSLYGYTTKKDLSSIGSFLFMALIGGILASVVNIFLQSPGIDWIISLAMVAVAVGLTAYDTQILKQMGLGNIGDDDAHSKAAIYGALKLYLDFILLFVHLLRILGNRR